MTPEVQAALDLDVTSPGCAELIRFEGADCMAIDTDEYHNLFQARATLAAEVRRLSEDAKRLDCSPLMLEVIGAVVAERKRQNAKWGANRNLHQWLWNTILMEEVGEVAEASFNTDTRGTEYLQEEVVQVAAVAVAYAENIIRGRSAARAAIDAAMKGTT